MEELMAQENINTEEMQEEVRVKLAEYEREKLRMLQSSAQQNQQVTKLRHNFKIV